MQEIILRNLLDNPEYFRKVFHHLSTKHFSTIESTELFKHLKMFINTYNSVPNKKEFGLFLKSASDMTDEVKSSTINLYKTILTDDKVENRDFLIKESERYIKRIELTDAILKSADIIKQDKDYDVVPAMVTDALKIKFDSNLGLDYNTSIEHRIEYYHKKNFGLSTGIPSVDKIMGGGFKPKTLSVFGAPSHTGKSMALISVASHQILKGKNVLFLSLEMSEEEITKRVDSNILDINSNDLWKVPEENLKAMFNNIAPNLGKLRVKEFPAGILNTFKLDAYLDELAQDENFVPDIIVIDYLTLMCSSKVTLAQAGNGYSYYKIISEELHGLAKDRNIPVVTAAQMNRSAYGNKEAGMEAVADSLGIVQTADVFIAMITDDVLKENNRMYLKFLKNRNTGILKTQLVGILVGNARLFDVENEEEHQSEITSVIPTTPALDFLSANSEADDTDFSMFNFAK